MSSCDLCLIYLSLAPHDNRIDFSRDVALQHTDGFEFGMSFRYTSGDVLRFFVSTKAAYRNDMQGAIGGAISASVQTMSNGFSGRCRHWTDPAKRCKACFRSQSFGIVAGGQKELGRANIAN